MAQLNTVLDYCYHSWRDNVQISVTAALLDFPYQQN